MALLFTESFDHFQTADLTAGYKWTSATGSPAIGTAYGRNGQGCRVYNVTTLKRNVSPSTAASGVFGIAIQSQALANTSVEIWNSSGVQLTWKVETDGSITIRRGTTSGTILATSVATITAGSWFYLEGTWTINNTTGSASVIINGVETSVSSADTQNQTDATWSTFVVSAGANNDWYVDDIYVLDTSGTVNNASLGDVTVGCLFPNGNGSNSAFVGSDSDSTDNYALVDEASANFPDDDTTYVASSTVGARDTYAFGAMTPATATIYGTQTCICASKDAVGTRTYTDVVKLSGGSEDDGTTTVGPSESSYRYGLFVRETKNGSDAWTVADVNAAEFGVTVAT